MFIFSQLAVQIIFYQCMNSVDTFVRPLRGHLQILQLPSLQLDDAKQILFVK